ncbi:MAG TPA: histidine ammonia-lyase, partial [Bacteroidetes bacterium]|nr:histidine ammonia-lyase [Bacteroidota bacterium]
NVESVLAIELLCAAQGIDLLRPLRSSPLIEQIVVAIRDVVPFAEHDRVLYRDMEAVRKLVADGSLSRIIGDRIE